jgi:tetratricopeptide (TPR) repeat protein
MTGGAYAAFISYNSADREVARRLQRALESYSIPKALRGRTTAFGVVGERIGKVCRDRTDFKSGESLNAALVEALDESSSLVVICSPDSARSKWVNAEVEHFQKTGRAARIFPLIVRTDESRVVVNSYPPALRRTDGDEAIAADLQETGDGWHDGVLKILASILDVDFDALRQRALEAARRRARLAYGVAGGMAALAAFAVAASVIAVDQRNRALQNFEESIRIAARSASRINEVAERTEVPRDLIYKHLTAVQEDLKSLSAMESLRRHPRALIVSAEFQLLLSDLFAEVGRVSDQLASSLAAEETLKSIKASAKNSTKRLIDSFIFGESNIEFSADDLEGEVAESLGKAWLSNGALERASAEFHRCRAGRVAFMETWELEPDETADAASGVLACSANEANALAMLNRPGLAINNLEADLATAGGDVRSAPFARLILAQLYADNGRLKDGLALLESEIRRVAGGTGRQERIELAKLLETRAKALALTGRIADASTDLERADALLSAFLANDSDDRRVLLVRGELLTATGEIEAFAGARDNAERVFADAEAILTRLVAYDETQRDWRLSRARLSISRADNVLRRYEDDPRDAASLSVAETSARAAIADIDAVYRKDDDVAARLRLIAEVSLARALRISGETKAARALLNEASARISNGTQSSTPMQDLLVAVVADEQGDLATTSGDFPAARRHYESAIARQRSYLTREPSASLVMRDLLWTMLASAKSLKAGGDARGANARLAEACGLKSGAALAEYSLFTRDAETAAGLARDWGVRC